MKRVFILEDMDGPALVAKILARDHKLKVVRGSKLTDAFFALEPKLQFDEVPADKPLFDAVLLDVSLPGVSEVMLYSNDGGEEPRTVAHPLGFNGFEYVKQHYKDALKPYIDPNRIGLYTAFSRMILEEVLPGENEELNLLFTKANLFDKGDKSVNMQILNWIESLPPIE
jgi:hypothetical protein